MELTEITEITIKDVTTPTLGETGCCTGDYTLLVGVGVHEIKVDGWCVAGWLAPGASQDLDGSGLANWGSSQRGGWSVCDGDGQYSGRVRVLRDRHDNYITPIKLGADHLAQSGVKPSMVPEWQAAVDLVVGLDQEDEEARDAAVSAAEAIRAALIERLDLLLENYAYECPEPDAETIFGGLDPIEGIEALDVRCGNYLGCGLVLAWRDADGYDFESHPNGTPEKLRRLLTSKLDRIISHEIGV